MFDSQEAVQEAFDKGELKRDFVAVVRFQGARANGMPELHRLTPLLGVLQDQGFHVALVTDGRMSGASGKVPAVIHLSPEALLQGPLGKVRTGDMLVIDAEAGVLDIEIDARRMGSARASTCRSIRPKTKSASAANCSAYSAAAATPAEQGASVFGAMVGERSGASRRTAARKLACRRTPEHHSQRQLKMRQNKDVPHNTGVAYENSKRYRAPRPGDSGARVRFGRTG